jgi:Flp pilus assembly protein TadG
MKFRKKDLLREQLGVETVEFAFVLPILALLLAGGIEFGRAFYTYNIVTKSVRNAARYVSDTVISPAGVIPTGSVNNAKRVAVYGRVTGGTKIIPDIAESNFSVSTAAGPAVGEFYVTVSANYAYTPLFQLVLPSATFRPKLTMVFTGYMSGT